VKWRECLYEAADKIGRPMDVAVHLKDWVTEARFEDVTEVKTIVPVNPWPKDKDLKTLGVSS
jgi:hypothetical protein